MVPSPQTTGHTGPSASALANSVAAGPVRLAKRIVKRLLGSTQNSPPPVPVVYHELLLKRAVIVQFFGGLANQMICYKLARYLADMNDASIILDVSVYKSEYREAGRDFQLGNYDIRYDMLVFADDVASRIRASNDVTYITKEMLSRPSEAGAIMESIRKSAVVHCDFWLAMCVRDDMDRHAEASSVLDELTLDYMKFSDEKGLALLTLIRGSANPVAIHVRRGDFRTHDGNLLLAREYYNESVAQMERRLDRPEFFVFSDDIEWCRANLQSSGELHFVDFSDDTRAFADMYLASQCSHFILSNESTFSHQIVQLSKPDAGRIVITSSMDDLERNGAGIQTV